MPSEKAMLMILIADLLSTRASDTRLVNSAGVCDPLFTLYPKHLLYSNSLAMQEGAWHTGIMRLLLGSGGHVPTERRQALVNEIRDFLGTKITKCLFVPYAHHEKTWAVSREEYYELGFNAGYELDPIYEKADQTQAVRDAQAFYFDGGNTYRFLNNLYKRNLLEPLREKILAGTPYIGLSAGTNLVCPTIQTSNDMPIVIPQSLSALNLVPFQINTHFVDIAFDPTYRAETKSLRIQEFHEENDIPVIGLREGAILRVEGDKVMLKGMNGARIFIKGQPPKDVLPDDPIDFLLRKNGNGAAH